MDKLSQMVLMGTAGVGKVGESFILQVGSTSTLPLLAKDFVIDGQDVYLLINRRTTTSSTLIVKLNSSLQIQWSKIITSLLPFSMFLFENILYVLMREGGTSSRNVIVTVNKETGELIESGRNITNNAFNSQSEIVTDGTNLIYVGRCQTTTGNINPSRLTIPLANLTSLPVATTLDITSADLSFVKIKDDVIYQVTSVSSTAANHRVRLTRTPGGVTLFKDVGAGNENARGGALGLDVDEDGNSYVAWRGTAGNLADNLVFPCVTKINASGTIVWSRRISQSSVGSTGGLVVLPNGEILLTCRSATLVVLVWMSSDGNFIRARTVMGSSAEVFQAKSIGDYVVISGLTAARISGSSANNAFVFSTPIDGSGIGDYVLNNVTVSYADFSTSLVNFGTTTVTSASLLTAASINAARPKSASNVSLVQSALKTNL